MERLEIGAPQVGHSKKTVAVMEGSSALLDPRRELPVADPYLHRIPRLNLRGPADDFPGFVGHDGEAPIQHGFRVEGRESLADPGQAGPPDTQEISHPPAGTPGQDAIADKGAIVCSCFSVGGNEIASAIEGGCMTVAAVGETLNAGTNCGSCRAEIQQIINEKRPIAAE